MLLSKQELTKIGDEVVIGHINGESGADDFDE